ncbi:MAG: hypothetical protein AB1424_12295 [Thermodesulfobacteriota bacterium]
MKKDEFYDNATGYLRKAIDTLFISSPENTSLGILFGLIVDGLSEVFKPFLINYSNFIDFTKIGAMRFIILGIFIFNLPLIIKKPKFPHNIEIALSLIKDAKKNKGLSNLQIKQMYLNLFQKILNELKI